MPTIGARSQATARSGSKVRTATSVARGWVSAFGRISPNTSISGVRITVAHREAWPPTQ